MAHPSTSITEPETQGSLRGAIDAALRIADSRAQKEKRMRQAILANDVETALTMACELAGFSHREAAKRVEGMLASDAKAQMPGK